MPVVLLLIEYDGELGIENQILGRFPIEVDDESIFWNSKIYLHVDAPAVRGSTPARRGILRCYQCNYSLCSATFPALPYIVRSESHPSVYATTCCDCNARNAEYSSSEDSDED